MKICRLFKYALLAIVLGASGGCEYQEFGSHKYQVGSIGYGVSISVPNNYIFFPFSYQGESAWEPKIEIPQRTLDSRILDFSMYLRWPNLEPHLRANDASYRWSREDGPRHGRHEWFVVGVNAEGDKIHNADLRNGNSGSARRLEFYLRNALKHGDDEWNESKFTFQEPNNESFGLHKAMLKDQADATDPRVITTIYWAGERGKKVTTLIVCARRVDRINLGLCKQQFNMDRDFAFAAVDITYDEDDFKWVQHWSLIESATKKLLLGFVVNK